MEHQHEHEENRGCGQHHEHEHHHHEHDEKCGCGQHHEHEHHHHEHDEECGCGQHHDHEHKQHHHEHDEECGCGHHHEHEPHHHEHGENCGCNHDHEHEHHHHHHDPNAPYIIDGHTHESASVGTGTLTVTGHYQELEDTVRNELKALADWATEQGGIIGHIKSSLVSSHTTMLSITEDEVNTISSDAEEVHINMAAIVFAIPLEDVKAQVESICKKLIQMTEGK